VKVLNAYAGIGGNRHLWPDDWQVTAVELDPRIAAEYARRYPDDVVLVEDAHAVVMDRAHEFDAVWTSPPCPTHSRLAKTVASRTGRPLEPDPRLWEEIAHLRTLGVAHVVENVHVYYTPPIAPDVVTERHWYWTSAAPLMLTPPAGTRGILMPDTPASAYAAAYGLPMSPRGALSDSRKAFRNAVIPLEGLEVATAAFESALSMVSDGR
jgi:DNA (cytosine-5)-methyltransferase 1